MNISSQELQKLRQELKTVREEVVWIQTVLERQGLLPARTSDYQAQPRVEPRLAEGEEWTPERLAQLDAYLVNQGLLSCPTADEIARVEAYEAEVSPVERRRIREELRQLELDPPLSEVIRWMREG